MAKKLYTIGYSGFPEPEDFVEALKDHGIQVLVDVRSSPYSAYYTAYDKDSLSPLLKQNGIIYVNYARQFGARQEDESLYRNGRMDFELFSQTERFLDGVRKIEKSQAVIAFMCAEKKPSTCHRAILVAKAFHDRGHEVNHILPDNSTITQEDIENELLETYFPDREQESLFEDSALSDEEYIAEAYRKRNDEIGFKLEDLRK